MFCIIFSEFLWVCEQWVAYKIAVDCFELTNNNKEIWLFGGVIKWFCNHMYALRLFSHPNRIELFCFYFDFHFIFFLLFGEETGWESTGSLIHWLCGFVYFTSSKREKYEKEETDSRLNNISQWIRHTHVSKCGKEFKNKFSWFEMQRTHKISV